MAHENAAPGSAVSASVRARRRASLSITVRGRGPASAHRILWSGRNPVKAALADAGPAGYLGLAPRVGALPGWSFRCNLDRFSKRR
jgi:hypothetical protein